MKRLLLVLVLAGCGQYDEASDNIANNYGYGYHFDAELNGVRVRYADDRSPRVEEVEAAFRSVVACVGAGHVAPPTLVIFLHEVHKSDGVLAGGWYADDTKTVFSTTVHNDQFYQPELVARIVRHELVHHVLDQIGFPRSRNHAHDSPFFEECVII